MPNDPGYWGGTTGINFYAGKGKPIPVIYDDDTPDQTMYILNDRVIQTIMPKGGGLDWLKGTDGKVLSRVQGRDSYFANLRSYYNMSCSNPRAVGIFTGITHTTV